MSPRPPKAPAVKDDAPETLTTAIHIPKSSWDLLRAVAFRRAQSRGGRASVSKLLVELVETQRSQLERELEG